MNTAIVYANFLNYLQIPVQFSFLLSLIKSLFYTFQCIIPIFYAYNRIIFHTLPDILAAPYENPDTLLLYHMFHSIPASFLYIRFSSPHPFAYSFHKSFIKYSCGEQSLFKYFCGIQKPFLARFKNFLVSFSS